MWRGISGACSMLRPCRTLQWVWLQGQMGHDGPYPRMTCQDANWHETLGSLASQLFAPIEASLQRPQS